MKVCKCGYVHRVTGIKIFTKNANNAMKKIRTTNCKRFKKLFQTKDKCGYVKKMSAKQKIILVVNFVENVHKKNHKKLKYCKKTTN